MKILETNFYNKLDIWEIIQIKYELNWKINTTPMFQIINNKIVVL